MKKQIPKILKNKKGEFYCNYLGKRCYLARDLKSAKLKLLAMLTEEKVNVPATPQRGELTVVELVEKFLVEHRNHSHFDQIKAAAKLLLCENKYTETRDFGPIALKACQKKYAQTGNSRWYINRIIRWIVIMFEWGVANELVHESRASALSYVKPLKYGEAHDNPPREEVSDANIMKTLPLLLPTVRDMVILQRTSGARPSEICSMTMDQITKQEEDLWIYEPRNFKTKHFGKKRAIAFGKYEIEILKKHAQGKKADESLFSPKDTWRERAETHGFVYAENSRLGDTYDKDSYRHAIMFAIKQANKQKEKDGDSDMIPYWTPYQLRHSSATFLTLVLGEKSASDALGHASLQITHRYIHAEAERAAKVVRERDAVAGKEIKKLTEFSSK